MLKRHQFLTMVLMLGLAFTMAAQADDQPWKKIAKQPHVTKFTLAQILLEQNFTDAETEVVIIAKGGSTGLKHFWLLAPDGKLVYEFTSPNNGRNIGGREILVESPEPPELDKILNAYPEGIYRFIGKSFDGQWLYSEAILNHQLPPPVSITFPLQDGIVSPGTLSVTWESEEEAAAYMVELKHVDSGRKLIVDIAGEQKIFQAPEKWLIPGALYQLGVVSINKMGNKTVVESTFSTGIE